MDSKITIQESIQTIIFVMNKSFKEMPTNFRLKIILYLIEKVLNIYSKKSQLMCFVKNPSNIVKTCDKSNKNLKSLGQLAKSLINFSDSSF